MTTRYFANAGNDGDAGDLAHPWQTITKFNATAWAGDDAALFNRGDTFVGRLHPTTSGSTGHVILIGAYGTGADPIIDGSADNAFYVSFDSNYVHHFWVEHIDFSGSLNHFGDYDSTVVCNSHDFYWYMCTFRDSGGTPDGHGFGAFSNDGTEIYNVIVDTCDAFDNTSSGICISSNAGSGGPHDCEIKYCETYSNGTIIWYHHGIYVKFGCTVYHNNCHDNTYGAGIKMNCESVYTSPYYPICYSNDSYHNFMGIHSGHKNAIAFNNLVYENEFNVNLDGDSIDVIFVFNTIMNATSADFRVEGDFSGTIIEDNLIIEDQAVHSEWLFTGAAGKLLSYLVAHNTIDYNIYYTDGIVGTDEFTDTGGNYNWTEWKALTGSPDAHSKFLLSLPEVTARYSDMHPLSGSGGGYFEGLGVAIGGYDTDKDGVTRPDPPTPGCYDIVGTPPPATSYGPRAWIDV